MLKDLYDKVRENSLSKPLNNHPPRLQILPPLDLYHINFIFIFFNNFPNLFVKRKCFPIIGKCATCPQFRKLGEK